METNTAAPRTPTLPSLLLALLIIVTGGWLVGMAVALVGSFFYLMLVFPIAMGFAGGKIAGKAVEVSKVTKAGQVLLLSLLTAVTIYGVSHYGRYLALQAGALLEMSARLPEATLAEKMMLGKVVVDMGLKEETGLTGFPGYMLYRAQTGFSIGKFYSQNRLDLAASLAWLY